MILLLLVLEVIERTFLVIYKFKFLDGLLYHDGPLYVPEGPMRFQIFKPHMTHWLLAI
jgi:hypothetical protein